MDFFLNFKEKMKNLFFLIFLIFSSKYFSQLYPEKDFKIREELSKKYDYVSYLNDDVAIFRTKNQKHGIIDSLGNVLAEAKFSYISDFEEGFAEAGNNIKGNFKRGIINKKGDIIIPFIYSDIFRCSKDRIRVGKNNKIGLIDYNNKVIIPILYDNIYESDDDKIFLVQKGNRFAYFDENGTQFTKFEFSNAERFRKGKASVILENNAGTLINEKGEKILNPIPNIEIYDYDNKNFYLVFNRKTKKKGVISNKGETVLPNIYEEIAIFEDRFIIKKNEKYAVFNSKNEQTTKYYDYIFPSIDNKLEVIDKDKKGVIDEDDNVFLPLIYSNLFALKDKFYVIKNEDFYTVLDINKNIIVPEKYKFYSVTEKNIIAEKDGEFYLISGENFENYKQISGVDKIYEKWLVQNIESSFLKISKQDKFGVMNLSGRFIIEPQYEDIIVYYSAIPFAAKKNGKWGLINEKNEIVKDFVYDYINFAKETIYLHSGKKKEAIGSRFASKLLED